MKEANELLKEEDYKEIIHTQSKVILELKNQITDSFRKIQKLEKQNDKLKKIINKIEAEVK